MKKDTNSSVPAGSNQRIFIGINETDFLLDGWYDRERGDDGIIYRATSQKAAMRLPYAGEKYLLQLIQMRPDLVGQTEVADLFWNGRWLGTLASIEPLWVWRSFTLPTTKPGWIQLEWVLRKTFIPDQIWGNGDGREIGILLSYLKLETGEI